MLDSLHILSLLSVRGIGCKTVKLACNAAKNSVSGPRELFDLITEVRKKTARQSKSNLQDLETGFLRAEEILRDCNTHGISALGIQEKDFPNRLATIENSPVILFVKGDISCLNSEHAVAVIGTRKPTQFGLAAAERLGRLLAESGIIVVSGLALGCDAGAHRGCVDVKGKTVAVLAHGLEKVYPSSNKMLADDILNNSGCLVSEYPPGTPARPTNFVERDRIQSGLSDGVIVVETGIKGGTMHTVKFCLEQGRKLACISHPQKFIDNPQAEGNQHLIREKKAQAIEDRSTVDDFINSLAKNNYYSSLKKKDSEVILDSTSQLDLF